MRFAILGTTRAWRPDGTEVPLGGRARRALLALLLLRPGAAVSPGTIIDILYGERPPKNASHALQSQVSRLRGDGIMVERVAAGYLLRVEPGEVDAHRFLRLADEGRQALDTDPAGAAALLAEALSLWRGPAVSDLGEAHAVPLEERRLAALEDRIEADLRRGAHHATLPELGELIGRHPLRERLRGQLMRALRADGRPAEALVAYEETRRLLADELGADPSPELSALHQSLLRGELSEQLTGDRQRPAARRAITTPLTTFVGRDDDLAAVRGLLGEARLVTLLGPGGAGKTRLAVEVARAHPDACLAELAALTDAADLPQALLDALGIRESGRFGGPAQVTGDAVSRLEAALAERPLLLVLDNCEHLAHAAAALAERLLTACPGLRVLATSREPLGITAEHLWPVRPLAPADAVRLFTDRASAIQPGFVPDDTVERICAALDGLPLAIELAAARMRTHEAAELAGRLAHQDRFRLLSRGSRTADPRHRTLHAVVAWSWELLTGPEREMAARLTVFAGGATADAAAAVCALPDAGDLLDSLADKSLVEVSGGRYRMLETIRAFCAAHLPDESLVRHAHATHFLALAMRAHPHLFRAGQLHWLEALAAEHDNLQGALRWAAESGRVELGMRLLAAQLPYLWMRGMRASATVAAVALLDAAGPEPDPALGDAYLLCLAVAASDGGGDLLFRHEAAALSMIERGAGAERFPLVGFLWPMVTASSLDPRVALSVMKRAKVSSDLWERSIGLLVWAYPQMAGGEFDAAEANLTAALDGFRELGDRWGSGLALDTLAGLAATRGDEATAVARTDEALVLAEQLGAAEDLPDLLCNRGDYRIGRDLEGARADYERAAELARRAAVPTYLGSALRGLGDVELAGGDLAAARGFYERALRLSEPRWVKSAGNLTRLLVGLGRLAEAGGDTAAAHDGYLRAIETSLATGAVLESVRAIEALAGLTAGHDAERAAALLGAATAIRGVAVPETPEAARVAARVRAELGERAAALARDEGARLSRAEALKLAGVSQAGIDASPLGMIAAFSGE